MKEKPQARIRLTLVANRAAPSPILGQALGQYGINIMDFCKNFNQQTKNVHDHVQIPTKIKIYATGNRTHYNMEIKIPSTTYLIKTTSKVVKASG